MTPPPMDSGSKRGPSLSLEGSELTGLEARRIPRDPDAGPQFAQTNCRVRADGEIAVVRESGHASPRLALPVDRAPRTQARGLLGSRACMSIASAEREQSLRGARRGA